LHRCLRDWNGVSPREQAADGEQEIGRLRRISRVARGLRGALRAQEALVTVLPAIDLRIEEMAFRRTVRELCHMRIDTGQKRCRAGPLGHDLPRFWRRD